MGYLFSFVMSCIKCGATARSVRMSHWFLVLHNSCQEFPPTFGFLLVCARTATTWQYFIIYMSFFPDRHPVFCSPAMACLVWACHVWSHVWRPLQVISPQEAALHWTTALSSAKLSCTVLSCTELHSASLHCTASDQTSALEWKCRLQF